jgi:hypothetical protein
MDGYVDPKARGRRTVQLYEPEQAVFGSVVVYAF